VKRLPSTKKPARATAFIVGAVAIATLMAACAGPGSGGSSKSATSPAQLAAATAITHKAINTRNALSMTAPLKTVPPKGKTFVWLNCELPACTEVGKGLLEATRVLGWKLKVIQFTESDVSALIPALQRALSYDPVGVALPGLPQALWKSVLPAYKAAGVPLIPSFVGPADINSTVIGNIGDGPNLTEYGSIMGNWFISDSKGRGNALDVRVDSLEYLKGISDSVDETVKAGCPGCSITNLQSTLQDVVGGKLTDQIVAALQRDPSIKYVISVQGGFLGGLHSAMKAAGLQDIKLVAACATTENLAAVKAGTETAMIGGAFQVAGFQIIDVVLRHLQGMTVDPYDGGLPKQLLVKSSTFKVASDYPAIAPFIPEYKALWRIK
jgi:ribose transport system substrate-binding protein